MNTAVSVSLARTDIDGMMHRWRVHTFVTLYVSYASYFFCRVNLSIAMPKIQAEFGWDKATVGIIASVYFAVYAIGKLVNGVLGDILGGRVMIVGGILLSAFANFVFGFGHALLFFAIVWGANAFFQSMGWAALVAVMANWFGVRERGKIMGWLSTNFQLGNVLAWLLSGLIIAHFEWPYLFWMPAVMLLAIGTTSWFNIKQSPESLALPAIEKWRKTSDEATLPPRQQEESQSTTGYIYFLKRMLAHPGFWIICFASLTLTYVRWVFTNWLPTYLTDQGVALSAAAFSVAIFPLLGSFGSIASGWMSDRFFESRRGPVIVLMCAGLAISILLMLASRGLAVSVQMIWMGLTGFTLYGAYTLLAGAAAIDFGTKHAAATAAGIIDAVGYVAAIGSGVVTGWAIDRLGWAAAFYAMALIAVLTSLGALMIWKTRPES